MRGKSSTPRARLTGVFRLDEATWVAGEGYNQRQAGQLRHALNQGQNRRQHTQYRELLQARHSTIAPDGVRV